jgi:hypothetical protein
MVGSSPKVTVFWTRLTHGHREIGTNYELVNTLATGLNDDLIVDHVMISHLGVMMKAQRLNFF